MTSLSSNRLFFIADHTSIFEILQSGIWYTSACNHSIDPLDSTLYRQVIDGEREDVATDINLKRYVHLFENCHEPLSHLEGNFTNLYIIALSPKLRGLKDVLRLRRIAEKVLTIQYAKNIMVDSSYFETTYAFSNESQTALKEAIRGRFSAKVEVNPEIFSPTPKKQDATLLEITIPSPKRERCEIQPTYNQQVTLEKGDLFKSGMQTLINTVNCVGVMGKGIALSFKRKYPAMFKDYKKRCNNKSVALGKPYPYKMVDGQQIINFPTKGHWKENSKLEDVENGLKYLAEHAKEWNIQSLAIPPLGCGNGNLSWTEVQPVILKYMLPLRIRVKVYAPHEANAFPSGSSSNQAKRYRSTSFSKK